MPALRTEIATATAPFAGNGGGAEFARKIAMQKSRALDYTGSLRSGPFPRQCGIAGGQDTAEARYPNSERLCYKRCAVKQGVQRAGVPDLRGEFRGAPCEKTAEIAKEPSRRVLTEEPTASHVPAPAHEDASRFCPVCSQRLESRRCKLVCNVCGYYMSCADYY
jgi:hypothetical protein